MIVDDGAAQRGVARQHGALLRRGLAALQRQRYPDLGAAAGLRAQRDIAAHALHDLPTDKQAQTAALHRHLLARRRLIPGIEQLRLLFRRNAAAAVAQGEDQLFIGGERQAYLALGGKLQGVGHQVVDHLLQPIRVDQHALRQRRQRLDDQRRAAGAHQRMIKALLLRQPCLQRQRTRREGKAVALDARVILQIVQQRQQRAGAAVDQRQVGGARFFQLR